MRFECTDKLTHIYVDSCQLLRVNVLTRSLFYQLIDSIYAYHMKTFTLLEIELKQFRNGNDESTTRSNETFIHSGKWVKELLKDR